MRYIIIVLLVISWATVSHAEQSLDTEPDITMVIGAGTFSCGKFMEYQKENNKVQQHLTVQWVWGFLIAYNFRSNFNSEYQQTSQIIIPDKPTVLLYMETYCQKNPIKKVLDGTFSLINTLNGNAIFPKTM